jgi:hypothetical protein
MNRTWILVPLFALAAGMGVTQLNRFDSRLTRLDREARSPAIAMALQEKIKGLTTEMEGLRAELEGSESSYAATRVDVMGEIQTLEAALDTTLDQLATQRADQHAALEALREQGVESTERLIEQRLSQFEQGAQDRIDGLSQVVSAAANLAEQTQHELGQISAGRSTDVDRDWRDMVGPTVQLAGEMTVGSAVLLISQPTEGGKYETLVLTSWHVIRDIRADALEDDPPIPVKLYSQEGSIAHETATLICYDATLDAALLRLDRDTQVTNGARLAPRERLGSVKIFQGIYAVGCPLGNDPIPTYGQVADVRHTVDENLYWMISAPTYIGNSGGGIYDYETHELLGIFSKIYTHGSMRPTVVPHMGLVTPLGQIYDWLEREGLARITPSDRNGPTVEVLVE